MADSRRVLLVEDNRADAVLLQDSLQGVGTHPFDIVWTDRLGKALERIKREAFDAVLLDLMLPDSKGLATLESLQTVSKAVPVVVVTGVEDEGVAISAIRQGAQDYLVKGTTDGRGMARAIEYAIDRKWAEEQVKASLREKELLLKEVHHRVKNNLQLITSLLRLQSSRVTDKRAQEVFRDCRDQIRSIALIHEWLYKSENLAKINLGPYLSHLVAELSRPMRRDPSRLSIRMDVEDVEAAIDIAVPCGLIVNELVSNCLKHAFPEGRKGEILVGLHSESDGTIFLTVADNGVGIPKHVRFEASESWGTQMVNLLTQQVHGTLTLERNGGTTVRIRIEKASVPASGSA